MVGPQDGPGAALRDLAQSLGFAHVLAYEGVARGEQQLKQTPVCFFLFAAVEDIDTLQPVAQQIRFCPGRRLRFSPLVYFSESASAETIQACINMGFDDVITLPFTHDRVLARLGRQLDGTVVFFETAQYVGPDRRGGARAQAGQYRRLEIVRTIGNGVTVLKDDTHAAA